MVSLRPQSISSLLSSLLRGGPSSKEDIESTFFYGENASNRITHTSPGKAIIQNKKKKLYTLGSPTTIFFIGWFPKHQYFLYRGPQGTTIFFKWLVDFQELFDLYVYPLVLPNSSSHTSGLGRCEFGTPFKAFSSSGGVLKRGPVMTSFSVSVALDVYRELICNTA